MKKLLSVLLAALCVFCLFAPVFAASSDDGATGAYTVTVAENSYGKFEIVPVADDEAPVNGKYYVKEGESFRFRIEFRNSYDQDQTTRFKAYPAKTYYADILRDSVDAEYGVILSPDADGVYTIDAVTEDIVIEAYNLDDGSFPWIKDFLFDMFNFFKRLFQWFFGLRSN